MSLRSGISGIWIRYGCHFLIAGVSAGLTYVANAIVTAIVAVSFGNYAGALFAGKARSGRRSSPRSS